MPSPITHLTPAQIDALGDELDELRARTVADLGERDREHLESVVRAQRVLEVAGRAMLAAGYLPPAWFGGTAALSLAKVLDNMEIGHNVMHGQYDFLQDPAFDGAAFDWDTVCPGDSWRRTHNVEHHTNTNIRGLDRDVGYGILRMTPEQPWSPKDLGNPVYALLLAILFEWGVMAHELEFEKLVAGEVGWEDKAEVWSEIKAKAASQALKDYVLWPVLSGPAAPFALAGNVVANLVRNVWAFTIIFCGHFPDGTHTYDPDEIDNERRGAWYLRQLLGAANLTGTPLFHLLTGNLSYQIEHHLFPDLPAHRLKELAPEVRAICERYGLPYNSGSLGQQFGSVVRKIVRLALPWTNGAEAPVPPPDRSRGPLPIDDVALDSIERRSRDAERVDVPAVA